MAITIRAKNGDEWLSINSLPSVTAQDDGKSLVVKNGEWAVAKVAGGAAGGSSGRTAQADWNEMNPSSASYIRNRTHYVDPNMTFKTKTIVDRTYTFENYNGACVADGTCTGIQLDDNAEVILQIDDNEPTTHRALSLMGMFILIGNPLSYISLMSSSEDGSTASLSGIEPMIMLVSGRLMAILPESYGEGSHRIRISTRVTSCQGNVANTTVNAKVVCAGKLPLGIMGVCDEYIDLHANEDYDVIYNGASYTMTAKSIMELSEILGSSEDDYEDDEYSTMIDALGIKFNALGLEALYPMLEAFAHAESDEDAIAGLLTDFTQPFILISISAMGMIERSFILDLTYKFSMEYGLKLNGKDVIPYDRHQGYVVPIDGVGLLFKHNITLQPGATYQLNHENKTYNSEVEVVYSDSNAFMGYQIEFGEEIRDSYTIKHPGGYEIEEEINYSTEVENGITYNVTTTYNGLTTTVERTAFISVMKFVQSPSLGYVVAIPGNCDASDQNGKEVALTLKIDGEKEAYHKINKNFLPAETNILSALIGLIGGPLSTSSTYEGRRTMSKGDAMIAKLAANPVGQLVSRIPAKVFENPVVKTIMK